MLWYKALVNYLLCITDTMNNFYEAYGNLLILLMFWLFSVTFKFPIPVCD